MKVELEVAHNKYPDYRPSAVIVTTTNNGLLEFSLKVNGEEQDTLFALDKVDVMKVLRILSE